MEMLNITIIAHFLIKTYTITYSKYTVFEISLALEDQFDVHLISLNLFLFFFGNHIHILPGFQHTESQLKGLP